jgi:hypothetical protein
VPDRFAIAQGADGNAADLHIGNHGDFRWQFVMLLAHAMADDGPLVQQAKIAREGDLLFNRDVPLVAKPQDQVRFPGLVDRGQLALVQRLGKVDVLDIRPECPVRRHDAHGNKGLCYCAHKGFLVFDTGQR